MTDGLENYSPPLPQVSIQGSPFYFYVFTMISNPQITQQITSSTISGTSPETLSQPSW